jgi:hypothetical protein
VIASLIFAALPQLDSVLGFVASFALFSSAERYYLGAIYLGGLLAEALSTARSVLSSSSALF